MDFDRSSSKSFMESSFQAQRECLQSSKRTGQLVSIMISSSEVLQISGFTSLDIMSVDLGKEEIGSFNSFCTTMNCWLPRSLIVFFALPFLIWTMQEDEVSRAGCRTAVNDLVFIVDGSWSVGFLNFDTAKKWLINVTNGFDVGTQFTDMAVVQYSDTPRLEIHLGQYKTRQELIDAIGGIKYLGGNTQTGRAIKFATDHVFPSSTRTSPARNKIAIVVTDGKSQDDVVDAAVEARSQNIIMFAVGVGSEITKSELVSIANKPSSAYVLFTEDYTTIEKIKEKMQQKLCEESVCPTRIPVASRDEKGFELMVGLKITQKAKKTQGSLTSEMAFLLSPEMDFTENTRDIFPEGLPPSYVFVATLRIKSPVNKETFHLWRIISKDGVPQAAVTLNGVEKSIIFTTTSITSEIQSVIFKEERLKKLFDEEWHQLKLLVRDIDITCFLDDIEIQKLRLYCDPQQSERETACEIYTVVSIFKMFSKLLNIDRHLE
ncbi:COLA1 protein, partial [Polypterus senegalus]|nr:COLA1 protein [Polypterus senegalus]